MVVAWRTSLYSTEESTQPWAQLLICESKENNGWHKHIVPKKRKTGVEGICNAIQAFSCITIKSKLEKTHCANPTLTKNVQVSPAIKHMAKPSILYNKKTKKY